MHRIDLLLRMVDLSNAGGAMAPDDAIAHLAALIHALDAADPDHQRIHEVLLRTGACLWDLRCQQLRQWQTLQ